MGNSSHLADVYPGNHLKLGKFESKGSVTVVSFSIDLADISLMPLFLIGEQFKDMPFMLQSITLKNDNGNLSGSINIEALGS